MVAPKKDTLQSLEAMLRELALGYPEAHEDFPWGERVIKVRKKIFLFLGLGPEGLGLSVKLPYSHGLALTFLWTQPAGYGLGKAGWVSARVPRSQDVPWELLEEWVDESYRAVAPKGLSATLPPVSRG